MKIGIYGGSFNPPHIAHLIVAESIRDQFRIDQVLWVPCYIPPHKTHLQLADAEHRLRMTRLATANNPSFAVSLLEIERKGTSFTVDTLRTLIANQPDDTFYLFIGEDSLLDFMMWREPEAIVAQCELLVYRRPQQQQHQDRVAEALIQFPEHIHFVDAPLLEISSESIRANIKAGKSIRHLVPDQVHAYILEHNLYNKQDLH